MFNLKHDGQSLGPFKTMGQVKSFQKRNPECKAWTMGQMTDPAFYEISKHGIVPKEQTLPASSDSPASRKS